MEFRVNGSRDLERPQPHPQGGGAGEISERRNPARTPQLTCQYRAFGARAHVHSEKGNSTRVESHYWCYCELIVIAVPASFAHFFPTFFKERNEGQIEAEILLDGAPRPLQVKYVEFRRTGASFILEHGRSNS